MISLFVNRLGRLYEHRFEWVWSIASHSLHSRKPRPADGIGFGPKCAQQLYAPPAIKRVLERPLMHKQKRKMRRDIQISLTEQVVEKKQPVPGKPYFKETAVIPRSSLP